MELLFCTTTIIIFFLTRKAKSKKFDTFLANYDFLSSSLQTLDIFKSRMLFLQDLHFQSFSFTFLKVQVNNQVSLALGPCALSFLVGGCGQEGFQIKNARAHYCRLIMQWLELLYAKLS